jgi:hypothetical protein
MAGKKKEPEDNRDIFEKALEALPAVGVAGGGIAGAVLGSLPGSKQARRILRSASKKPFTKQEVEILNRMDRTTPPKMFAGGAIGAGAGGYAGSKVESTFSKRRK